MQTILVCDDDKQIVEAINIYLTGEGFEVIKAYDGYEALEYLEDHEVNLMIVDVMMPGLDGIRTTLKVRETSSIPIIILSAKSEDTDKILGLNIGADDYITKPFSPHEVMARVRAILRRLQRVEGKKQLFTCDNLTINLDDYIATIGNEALSLTKKELEIFWTLATHQGKVFSRDQLLDSLWGHDYYGDNRTVDSHIRRLRSKLDSYDHPQWEIKTIWGVGYKFEALS